MTVLSSSSNFVFIGYALLCVCLLFTWAVNAEGDVPVCSNAQHKALSEHTDYTWKLYMLAIPHSASTTTTRYVENAKNPWINTTLVCGDYELQWSSCHGGETSEYYNATGIVERLVWDRKQHANFNQITKLAETSLETKQTQLIPFTILRDPVRLMKSQYRERVAWDSNFANEYPGADDVETLTFPTWARKVHWRHNLQTKALATDTLMIWVTAYQKRYQSGQAKEILKHQSDEQNQLGKDSPWLQLALERLEFGMPFFGIFERLQDTMDLFGFTTCQFGPFQERYTKMASTPPEETDAIQTYHALDRILYEKAVEIFDQRVADMRAKQALGWKCDLNAILRYSSSDNLKASAEAEQPFGGQCVVSRDDVSTKDEL